MHPTYPYVFSRDILDLLNGRSQGLAPFCTRMKGLVEKCDLRCEVFDGRVLRPLHRGTRSSSYRPDPADARKSDVPPYEARCRTMQHISSYEDGATVYTDGSKTREGVGCAFVTGRDTRSFSLPASASVFSTEILVIDKTLC